MNAETVDRVFRAMKRACGRELCLEAFVVEYGPIEPGPIARCRTCGKRWAVTETGMRLLAGPSDAHVESEARLRQDASGLATSNRC